MKGIQSALGPNFKEALPESEAASRQTVEQKEAVKHNISGMGVLIKTNKSEEMLVMIDSTVSEAWPFGRVDLVMELMDKKFRPKDSMSKADQRQRLGELTLKEDEDPHDFSLKIAALELEYNNKLTEEDKVATLLSVAGVKYGSTVLGERRLLESQGEDITSGAIIDVMRKLWRVSKKRKTPSNASETSLADFAANKECFHCGEKGHLKAQCPKLRGKRGGTPSGMVCDLCEQTGHTKDRCWEDPKNAHLRPRNWVSRLKNKSGEAATSCVEIFL